MAGSNPPRSRSPTPNAQQEYDVTRMREEDFERLAVYIVPDVACERGTLGRAEKTLPRSLTLKPSLVLSTPTTPVSSPIFVRPLTSRTQTESPWLIFNAISLQTEGVWSTGVIPRGTRFGPFEGVRTPNYPNDKTSWRYFWRVCTMIFLLILYFLHNKILISYLLSDIIYFK